MAKAVKTKKKGQFNVEEINALNKKYEGDLTRNDYFKYIILPGLVGAIVAILFTYFWWLAVILGILGVFYGYKYILPNIVKQNYFLASLKERNRFVNNMTQILTDRSKTIINALQAATSRAKGELYQDLKTLQASLSGADKEQVAEAFKIIRIKYQHDVVFVQYLEQLETLAQEGKGVGTKKDEEGGPLDTLKEIKSYHNDMMLLQFKFMSLKDKHLGDMKQLIFVVCIIMAALTFSFGFKTYFESFARSPIGWVTSLVYLTAMFMSINKFRKLYFDNEIMFVSKK